MLRVALTGGLASGKTFVSSVFAELGCLVIHADQLGHEVLLPEGEAYAEVVREFGPDILDEAGLIQRRKLASLVFENPERLALLNSLVHPPVRARTERLIADFVALHPDGIVISEAAIHIETGNYKHYDKLVLAVCTPEQQIARAIHRDGVTREEVLARLSRQMPLDEKRKYADYVIDTSGSKEDTARQTREVYAQLLNTPAS